jgi:hypothetical protein
MRDDFGFYFPLVAIRKVKAREHMLRQFRQLQEQVAMDPNLLFFQGATDISIYQSRT